MMVCVVIAIRGASRDWDTFTPTLTPTNFVLPATPYPNGFFAPRGSVGAAVTGVGSTLSSGSGSFPHTLVASTRIIYVAAQFDTTGTVPLFDDTVPLQPLQQYVRASVPGDALTVVVFDTEYAEASIITPVTIETDSSQPWIVASLAVESYDQLDATLDNHRGKLLRRLLKTPWDTSWGSNVSNVLTAIGSVDNDIGGLFGDDFLPNGDNLANNQ
jgi:hypothetical protein